jgi:cellulose synthase/poly-beta-1,6-N-acetylglucosamine synthase-like glycosyltransferase
MDLVVRLHRYLKEHKLPDSTTFIPDPVAWTEVPSSVRVLGRQRERWQRGLLETLWVHRDLLFNVRYGAVGLIAYPFFLFGEALSPAIEVLGYAGVAAGLAFGVVDLQFVWLFLSVAVLYGMLLSVWAILLEEVSFRKYQRPGDVVRLLLTSVAEAFVYRPLTLAFRLKAFWHLVRGDKRWGTMKREGFGRSAPGSDARKAA